MNLIGKVGDFFWHPNFQIHGEGFRIYRKKVDEGKPMDFFVGTLIFRYIYAGPN